MDTNPPERMTVELTVAEAELVVSALRQFEPFWPSQVDDPGRAELLAKIRTSVERVSGELTPS